MGETRNPALGDWIVFEGDKPRPYGPDRGMDVDYPITWPLTLRVHRIIDGVWEGIDVEIDEGLHVAEVKRERLVTRGPGEGLHVIERFDVVVVAASTTTEHVDLGGPDHEIARDPALEGDAP